MGNSQSTEQSDTDLMKTITIMTGEKKKVQMASLVKQLVYMPEFAERIKGGEKSTKKYISLSVI